MDSNLVAAGWIHRFASQLQRHDFDRENAVSLAAQVWNEGGACRSPEDAATILGTMWGRPLPRNQ